MYRMGNNKSQPLENLTEMMKAAHLQLPHPGRSVVDTETKSGTNERLNLLNLAGELQNLIIVNLHPAAALALSQTNRHFHSSVGLHRLPFPVAFRILQEKELFSPDPENFACYTCFRLKPQSTFVLKQTKRRRSKLGRDAHKRFCTECGCKYGKHKPGSIFITSAGLRVSCVGCESLQDRFCMKCCY